MCKPFREDDVCVAHALVRSEERGSTEERTKQNTGLELEVQFVKKMLENFIISQEETGFPLLK